MLLTIAAVSSTQPRFWKVIRKVSGSYILGRVGSRDMVVDTRWPGATRYELRPVGLSGGGGGSNSDCRAPLSTALGLVVMSIVTGPQTLPTLPCQWEMAGNPTCLSSSGLTFENNTFHTWRDDSLRHRLSGHIAEPPPHVFFGCLR
jgi:hypothetical protein